MKSRVLRTLLITLLVAFTLISQVRLLPNNLHPSAWSNRARVYPM